MDFAQYYKLYYIYNSCMYEYTMYYVYAVKY